MIVTILFVAFAASAAGVWVFRRFAGSREILLDLPNERSSHTAPTIRGGGLVLVLVCLGLYVLSAAILSIPINWGYIVGAALIAGVSLLDDLYTLSAAVRMPVHVIAAVALIAAAGPARSLNVPLWGEVEFGWAGYLLTVFWVVWAINAYNFMDGIDGIAGIQAAVAGLGWALAGTLSASPVPILVGSAAAGAACGFLLHNWSPAKVFMGDVGSAFLGFTFAALPLLAAEENRSAGHFAFAGIVFLWPFIFDTVFTLLRRAAKGERVWEPHRQHLYQLAVIRGAGHRMVSFFYGIAAVVAVGLTLASNFSTSAFEPLLVAYLIASAAALYAMPQAKRV